MATTKRIARPAEHTLRHLWLAGLGLGLVTRRQAAHVRELAQRIAAGQAQVARQVLNRLGEQVPEPIRERIPRPIRNRISARLRPTAATPAPSPSIPQGRALQVPASKSASSAVAPMRQARQGPPSRVARKPGEAFGAPSSARPPHPPSTTGAATTPRPPVRRGRRG